MRFCGIGGRAEALKRANAIRLEGLSGRDTRHQRSKMEAKRPDFCGRRKQNTRIVCGPKPSLTSPPFVSYQELSMRILRSVDCELSFVAVKRWTRIIRPPQRAQFHRVAETG